MAFSANPELLDAIWRALNEPTPKSCKLASTWDRAANSGWMTEIAFEDALDLLDPRVARAGLRPETLAGILELSTRVVYARPSSRFDEPTGYYSYAVADVAAILILLERLGFVADPEPLCARIRPSLQSAPQLTHQELDVLFHDKSAHRTSPLTLAADITKWRGRTVSKFKTPAGYMVEYAVDNGGSALSLTVKAPKHRKRPEPQHTTCAQCGMTYVKGLPQDDKEHRATHRRWLAVMQPEPSRKFIEVQARDPLGAVWVDAASPTWLRDLVYRRAYAFKREMEYDYTQWSIDPRHDADPVAFLFSDGDGRVVGAAGFRPQQGRERAWRLDWIWILPDRRRSGLLANQWAMFQERFGEFDVEPPVSEAMKAFLYKRGLSHLAG